MTTSTLTSINADEVERAIADDNDFNYHENTIVSDFVDRKDYSGSGINRF
jgi:hypothetical protein